MQADTAEARFILHSLREDSDPAALCPPDDEFPAFWKRMIAAAVRHGVTAFVQRALVRAGIVPPPEHCVALDAAVRAALTRTLLHDCELHRIGGALAAAGLPYAVLKGPVLARTIYAAPALRPYTDLDLLVQEVHEPAVVAVLRGCGLVEIPFEGEMARRAHAPCLRDGAPFHRVFTSADGQTLVDLHLDPLQLGLRPAHIESLWRWVRPLDSLPGAWQLSPADQVVHLSVHAQKHGYARLIWLKDLDLLLRAQGDIIDWRAVITIARREGVAASVWYSVWLAHSLLSTPAPRAALIRLRPAPLVRSLYRRVWPRAEIAGLAGRSRRRSVQFHAAESWRGTLPSLVLMGRRRDRARALLELTWRRLSRPAYPAHRPPVHTSIYPQLQHAEVVDAPPRLHQIRTLPAREVLK